MDAPTDTPFTLFNWMRFCKKMLKGLAEIKTQLVPAAVYPDGQ